MCNKISYYLQVCVVSSNIIRKNEGRLLKVLKNEAEFRLPKERKQYGQPQYNNGYNNYQPTTQASLFGFLNPSTYGNNYQQGYGQGYNNNGQQNSYNNQNAPQYYPTTLGFPFNLLPTTTTTTPAPFPMNLFQRPATEPPKPFPFNLFFPTTPPPFPFNLFG